MIVKVYSTMQSRAAGQLATAQLILVKLVIVQIASENYIGDFCNAPMHALDMLSYGRIINFW